MVITKLITMLCYLVNFVIIINKVQGATGLTKGFLGVDFSLILDSWYK